MFFHVFLIVLSTIDSVILQLLNSEIEDPNLAVRAVGSEN